MFLRLEGVMKFRILFYSNHVSCLEAAQFCFSAILQIFQDYTLIFESINFSSTSTFSKNAKHFGPNLELNWNTFLFFLFLFFWHWESPFDLHHNVVLIQYLKNVCKGFLEMDSWLIKDWKDSLSLTLDPLWNLFFYIFTSLLPSDSIMCDLGLTFYRCDHIPLTTSLVTGRQQKLGDSVALMAAV